MVFRRWPHSAKKLNSDVYMLLARSTCCLFVVGCILILDLIIRSQTSSRSDDVSPYLMVSCAAGAREKIPRTFADRVPLFYKIVLTSLVGLLVCWCVGASTLVHRTPPKEHGFQRRGRLWRSLFMRSIHLCPRPKPF